MNKIELILKAIEVLLAFIGVVFIVFGWIIPNRQDKEKIRMQQEQVIELEKIKWKKDLIDQQISKLYGPIYALINEGNVTFSLITNQLGRKYIFASGETFQDLNQNEQLIWKHYVDTYKIKSQLKIAEILRNNIHLIKDSKIPDSYYLFLDYTLGWELLSNQKQNNVPNYYEYYYSYNYPKNFDKYIEDTLNCLLKQQEELIHLSEAKSV